MRSGWVEWQQSDGHSCSHRTESDLVRNVGGIEKASRMFARASSSARPDLASGTLVLGSPKTIYHNGARNQNSYGITVGPI